MRGRLHLTARVARKSALRLALLCAPAAAATAIAAGPAAAAGLCVYPISITASGTTVTGTFSVKCANTQVSLVSIVHAANPSDDSIFASSTGTFDVGDHTLQVELKCGANTEADLIAGPPTLYPPLDQDLKTAAFHVDCPPPPPPPPPPPGPPSPPTSSSPPPSEQPSNPARAGYCDASGKFYDLVVGQDKQPPYDKLGLRPADVNPQTGAIYCAPPTSSVATLASVPPAATPPVTKAVAPAKKTVHKAKRVVVKVKHVVKPKKRSGILGAHKKGATLPFTK
jgi:hypothetical protein